MALENKINKFVSKKLQFIAKCWIFFPILYVIYCLVILQCGASGIAKLILSPFFWVLCASSMWTGFSIGTIQWYAWGIFIFSNILLAYENALVLAYFSYSDYKFILFILSCLFQGVVILIVNSEIRVPYYSPRIRWWESDPRYKLSVKAKLKREGSDGYDSADIIDISRGGCFVKINQDYPMDSELVVDFEIFDKKISCMGLVVWATESSITHPKGIGIRFINLDRKTIKILKESSKQLKKMAQNYNEIIREKNWHEYLERERQFQERQKFRNRS